MPEVPSVRRDKSPVVGERMNIPFVSLKASTIDGACSAIHAVDADLIRCQAYNRPILYMSSMCCGTFLAFESIPKYPCR